MKIGLICPYDITKGSGVKEVVLALRPRLDALGHKALVITPQPKNLYDMGIAGVRFIGQQKDFRSPLHTTAQISASFDTDELDHLLAEEQFDVLHFHEPWVPYLSRQILSRSETVNIATFHAKIPETLVGRTVAKVITPYTKSLLKYLDQLTAVSDVASEYVRGLTSRDITIIPNGIDLDLYKTRGGDVVSKKTGKQILFIGRLEVRKGLKYLLKAFSLVKQIHPDLRLEVVGDGPDRQKLEKLVQEEELRGVRFLGLVSELTKIRLLHESDLFCSPAIFGESFGIVLLEAMACNLVTVAGDNSGYASVMKDTGKISLVNPKDINDFARRLELMIYFPEIRTLWQSWAQEYIQQFNYDDVARQYEALYKVAVREKNRVSKHRI